MLRLTSVGLSAGMGWRVIAALVLVVCIVQTAPAWAFVFGEPIPTLPPIVGDPPPGGGGSPPPGDDPPPTDIPPDDPPTDPPPLVGPDPPDMPGELPPDLIPAEMGDPPGPDSAPEPSTLIGALTGAALTGLAIHWRRNRRSREKLNDS